MRPSRSTWRSSPTRLSPATRSAAMAIAPLGVERGDVLRFKQRAGNRAGRSAPMHGSPRPLSLDLSRAFARFREADPDRLHFSAHSHHFWPDVTRKAQLAAWDDAARFADDKWECILGEVWRDV